MSSLKMFFFLPKPSSKRLPGTPIPYDLIWSFWRLFLAISKSKHFKSIWQITLKTCSKIHLKHIQYTNLHQSAIRWKLYKMAWLRHFRQPHPLYRLDWSMSILYKWFARKFSSIKWLGWCISWLYKMLCANILSIKCPGCSTNSLLKGHVSLYKVLCHVYSPNKKILARNHWGDWLL